MYSDDRQRERLELVEKEQEIEVVRQIVADLPAGWKSRMSDLRPIANPGAIECLRRSDGARADAVLEFAEREQARGGSG